MGPCNVAVIWNNRIDKNIGMPVSTTGVRVMGSEREARGSGSVKVLPTSAVGETASSVLGGEEGWLLLVRRVFIVFCGWSASSQWTLGS